MIEIIRKRISESIKIKDDILSNENTLSDIAKAAKAMIGSYENGGRIFFCGNGGSAADAQHLAAELVYRFYLERRPLPAEALSVNTSVISAISNDDCYDNAFAIQLQANARPGDVLFGISTSGKSKSVINALKKARGMKITTIGLTGAKPCPMDKLCDIRIKVPSADTPRVQEAHIMVGHILCEIVESALRG